MERKDVNRSVYLKIDNSEVTDYPSNSNKLQNSRTMQSILSLGYGLDDPRFHFRQGKKEELSVPHGSFKMFPEPLYF